MSFQNRHQSKTDVSFLVKMMQHVFYFPQFVPDSQLPDDQTLSSILHHLIAEVNRRDKHYALSIQISKDYTAVLPK